MTYLDFELEISEGAGREYPVRVVHSPAGEARETMRFPFDELALQNHLLKLQNALLRSGGKTRKMPLPEEQAVLDFGRALFDALFIGEVRTRYDMSWREATQKDLGLRLKLRIQSPSLAALPWEFLYDTRQAEYVCLSRNTPIVRYLEIPQPIQPLTVAPPLRILGMAVSPHDPYLGKLDIAREKQRVENATKSLRERGVLELVWLEGETWRDLHKAMRGGPWHIFHFIGHGGFDKHTDEGLIYLANETGESERLPATSLGRLLSDHRSLRLVLLNACEGARGSDRDLFSSTAAILVRRGLPAVLAMQYAITDNAAIEFSRAFYDVLAEGMAVDTAVVEARKAVSFAVSNTIEWGTPVLYMRAPDGKVFEMSNLGVHTPALPKAPLPPQEKEEEKLYKQYKREGDVFFEQGKYGEARLKYANALAQSPEDEYLDERINICNQRLAEQKATAARAIFFAKHTREGDAQFDQGEYEQAKSLYEQALSFNSGDQYVANRIQACDKLIVDLKLENMVLIPAGTFTMGSNDNNDYYGTDEGPPHQISVEAFYMDKYAVTVAQYQKFLAANPAQTKPANWKEQIQNMNRPVVYISWHNAVDYCNWLSQKRGIRVRLPTEAEWEFAARGGLNGKKYPWGDDSPTGKANFGRRYSSTWSEGAEKYLMNVDSFDANEYGLFNMAGNVLEWCADWYDNYYYHTSPSQNPKGPVSGAYRVLRGGSWVSYPNDLRCACRYDVAPADRDNYIGFRCAQEVR